MSMEEEVSSGTQSAGDAVFQNPLDDEDKNDAAVFEGELAEKPPPVSPTGRQRVASNAHHVQKFVNEQGA